MRAVWKFPFRMASLFSLDMPAGAKILHVDMQFAHPCLWAEVDTDAPKELRQFSVYGTGHPVTMPGAQYVGTFLQAGGSLVWHLYEIR